jgi:hypothetical protein
MQARGWRNFWAQRKSNIRAVCRVPRGDARDGWGLA